MSGLIKPLRGSRSYQLSSIAKLPMDHDIVPCDQTAATPQVSELYHETSLGVVGLSVMDQALPPDLQHRIAVQGAFSSRQLKRIVVIAGVDAVFQPIDFLRLSARFSGCFDRFLLLNDVAVEACRAANLSFQIRGYVRENDLASPSTLLTCPYWT